MSLRKRGSLANSESAAAMDWCMLGKDVADLSWTAADRRRRWTALQLGWVLIAVCANAQLLTFIKLKDPISMHRRR